MDMPRDGRPPKFDGSNYAYWKTLMRAYLRAIDERVWLSVVNGYFEHVVTVGEVTTPKPLTDWDRGDYETKGWNNKALSTIFNGVTPDEFRHISTHETAKEARDILEITHEGTDLVKIQNFKSSQLLLKPFVWTKKKPFMSFMQN